MANFEITYQLTLVEGEEIDEKIESICLEQSVELPRNVISSDIAEKAVGKLISREKLGKNKYKIVIGWPSAIVGNDISQFLNVLYGNISLQPGIRIVDANWTTLFPNLFKGPMFGISKIRKAYGIKERALSATALKPLGSSPSELADFCYKFACGGIDIIKDDHGLANQDFALFKDRVTACVSAIAKATEETGRRSYYYPNITAFAADTLDRYRKTADLGADGVLLCPHICGLETLHRLARAEIELPIIAHPAFSGQLTTDKSRGFSPDFLYGSLWRALGADFVIYPNKGGRFSFTLAECRALNEAARTSKSPFSASFPMPGGGIKIENIKRWISEYGNETVFLIGGSLYQHPDGIKQAVEEFRYALHQK